MLKHVTLINPPQLYTRYQVTAGIVPPLGLLYLASYLKRDGIDAEVIDSTGSGYDQYNEYRNMLVRGLAFEEVLRRIPDHTDLIGVSALYSPAHILTKELLRLIREAFPSKKIVIGGAHASVLPELVLNETEADIAVIGEGELTLSDLCRRPGELADIQGLAYKKDGRVFFNERRKLIENLDDLPFPDRSLIEIGNYFKAAEPHGCSASGLWTTILSSRGCPYECTFCTTPAIWQRRWRKRSVGSVIREMTELNRKHGVIDFHFEDENMGFDKVWMREFCDSVVESALRFTWQPSNGLRVETVLEPGMMEKMRRSGCSLVVFALESASERVRNEIIRKRLDIGNIDRAVSLANKTGIKSACYFIIGLPGERLEEAAQTIRYVGRLARKGLDECVIALFSMLPGSELFNDLYRRGKIKPDHDFFQQLLAMGDLTFFKSWTEYISGKELKALRLRGYLSFIFYKALFWPLKTIGMLCNIIRGRDQLKSERVLRTFIKNNILSCFSRSKGAKKIPGNQDRILRSEKEYHDRLASNIDTEGMDVDTYLEGSTSPETRFILRNLGDIHGKRLLDLGCGAGYSSVAFARKGAFCTAVDVSPRMVEKALTLAGRNGVRIETMVSDALRTPFPSSSFDIVYAANLLHHVDPEKALSEIYRILKPGGKICFWDPLRHNPIINIYRRVTKNNRTPDEKPLDIGIINIAGKIFKDVVYDTFWIVTLWLFIRFYFFDRVDPNKEHYWLKIKTEEKNLRDRYYRLERLDEIIKKMPFMKRFAWNIAVVATK